MTSSSNVNPQWIW